MALDVVPEKVEMLNRRESPTVDSEIHYYLKKKKLNLRATLDKREAFEGANFVVIATPTDYDPETNSFNIGSVDSAVQDVMRINPGAAMIDPDPISLPLRS